ncbi:MAG: glucokinase [Gammaproteobacteria bacterium]|nr:glucokinase [Gammaproteobacteria bacterium]
MKILTGDIGGTKTRIAFLKSTVNGLKTLREATYPSRDHDSLTSILFDFMQEQDHLPQAAGFAIAGPVDGRVCQVTNLPWRIDADKLENLLSVPRVILLNDLEATAWGTYILGDDDMVTLQKGAEGASGNRCVIAAGTGLGQAGLFWNGKRHTPFASEGGHCDFAPRTELEFELLTHLQQQYGHVSWERVVSGPGLVAIYRFLNKFHNLSIPEPISQKMATDDPAAVIVNTADQEQDPICVETMELFSRLYGAESGNQALKHMATGGVYIGGGIAPKILPWLKKPGFLEAFRDKGQMSDLMTRMAVKVILNDRTALYGPAVRLLSS